MSKTLPNPNPVADYLADRLEQLAAQIRARHPISATVSENLQIEETGESGGYATHAPTGHLTVSVEIEWGPANG